MRKYIWLVLVVILALESSVVPAFSQKPIDGVVVSGDVSRLVLCSRNGNHSIYDLLIQLRVKNVASQPAIISSASAITDYYRFARHARSLGSTEYAHIGWSSTITQSDPEPIPEAPVVPFKVVAPNETIEVDVDLRALVIGKLKPGPMFVQIVAENWPNYTKDYTVKVKHAWSAYGVLWTHSLHSEPISFVVPPTLTETKCF